MREVALPAESVLPAETATFLACVAAILELPLAALPEPQGEDPVSGIRRWLAGRGLGLVPIAAPGTFAWAGPWIAWIHAAGGGRRAVVMFGVPSGVAWDPSGVTDAAGLEIADGFLIAPLDVALAPPPGADAPVTAGRVEAIWIAPTAAAPQVAVEAVQALAGRGLEGDRHVAGTGTFPSGQPGSALTLIEAEVCDTFAPPLGPDEHRRNVLTRGIALNGLVGHEFTIGTVHCRGMRLCEPCVVVERYASRPVLRALVHRGGLRADIVSGGAIAVGDAVRPG
jgi:MOSC domain-containing protein YiiM